MRKILAMVTVLALMVCCGAASADTFIQGIDPEYNPFSYMGDNGEYTGFDVEICKAACEVAGLDYQVFAVNWDNKLVQLDAGECDVIWSGMTIADTMKEAGYVISAPYYDSSQVQVVAVQLGTSGEALLNGDLSALKVSFHEPVTTENFLMAFTELEGGAVDAVFVDSPVAENYVSGKDSLKILDETLGAEQYGLAFRAGDEELCAKIEAAVQTLVENGTYAEIAAKYPGIVNNLLFLNAK